MSSLVVGGVAIPVAVSSPAWTRTDAVDRGRMFDGTFFASESGGATRDWTFSTTPVTQADADTYIAVLGSPAAKLCSGDILQLPTMCSPELPSGKPTRAASSNRVVLDFMLHEIQPSKVLLRYAPGDTITGENFTGPAGRRYYDSAGVVQSAGSNVKRDAHYVGGVRTFLREGASTNLCLQAEAFGTTWSVSNVTIGTNTQTAPDGSVTADKIQEDNTTNVHAVLQTFGGLTNDTVYTFSVYLRGGERTWAILNILGKDGTSRLAWFNLSGAGSVGTTSGIVRSSIVAVSSAFYRCSIAATVSSGGSTPTTLIYAATGDNILSYLGTTGSGIYAWGAQLEAKPFATSYIPTTTGSVSRTAESHSLPYTSLPGETSVYLKFFEGGSVFTGAARLFEIASGAGAAPRLVGYSPGAPFYRGYHENGVSSVQSDLAAAPVIGDTVEVLVRLFGDGSVDIQQSINGAVATSGAQTASLSVAAAWSAALVWINSGGTVGGTEGFSAFQSFKIVAGMRSLADMRAA